MMFTCTSGAYDQDIYFNFIKLFVKIKDPFNLLYKTVVCIFGKSLSPLDIY